MSGGNDPLVVEDWSAYEKSMLGVLREEWRTRLKLVPIEQPISPEDLRQFVQGKAIEPEPVESAPLEPSISEPAPQSADFPHPSLLTSHSSRVRLRWRVPLLVATLIVSAAGVATIVKQDRRANRAPEAVVAQGRLAAGDSNTVAPATNPAPANEPGKSEPEAPVSNEYEVSGDRVRMRSAPEGNAPILRVLRQGAAVTIAERSAQDGWCRVQASNGREGWMKCEFLKQAGPTRQD